MNKQELLEALRAKLNGLPKEDIDEACDYYSEIIDEMCIRDSAYSAVSGKLSEDGCDLPVDVAYQDRRGPVYKII